MKVKVAADRDFGVLEVAAPAPLLAFVAPKDPKKQLNGAAQR